MNKNERSICWFSSLLITLLMDSPKMLALRDNGFMAHVWRFNFWELLFQMLLNFFFCWTLFQANLSPASLVSVYRDKKKYNLYIAANIGILLFFLVVGGCIQYYLFNYKQVLRIYWLGYTTRLTLGGMLTGILIKILLLLREGKRKDSENEKLKLANMETELELLKEQMNPHFLFNSLSSLSGVIRENPELAQTYVRDLSNVFRYVLNRSKFNLVTVSEELTMLRSFAQLAVMRLEDAFCLDINIDTAYFSYKLPHLSLQPLLENAVKHNIATLEHPLKVEIFIKDEKLVMTNFISKKKEPEISNGIGLANLNERYKIMMHQDIEISNDNNRFTVRLPLKA
jgi:two-component system LytT family sensor kinase